MPAALRNFNGFSGEETLTSHRSQNPVCTLGSPALSCPTYYVSNQPATFRQKLGPALKRFFRHPVSILFWFIAFSLIVEENYPFSHYPMYKGFSEETFYLYIASEGKPVPAKPIFKVSVPKMKKLYGNHMDQIAEERTEASGGKIRPYEMGDDAKKEAGERLLKQLRKAVPKKQQKEYAEILAKPLTLMRVDILYKDGKFTKTPHEIVSK